MTTMRDDRDLEQLLRETLATRAGTVDRGPSWRGSDEAPRKPHRWLAPLIAAAIVLAVAGGVIAIEHSSGPTQPTHPTPVQSLIPSPTATPTPSPTDTVQRACRTTLPAEWETAIKDGTITAGALSAMPLSVGADGSVLVARDFGSSRDVAVVSPDGKPRRIYSIASPDQNQVEDGVLEGHWALVPVIRLPRGANGVDPTVVRLVLVNTTSLATRTLATATDADVQHGRNVVDGATMFNGRVYYDFRPVYGKSAGVVHEYDIATGADRIIASGKVGAPHLYGRGVGWTDSGLDTPIARALPAPVDRDTDSLRAANELTTDGTAFAWMDSPHRIAWFGAGSTQPTRIVVPDKDQVDVVQVVGPIVLFEGDGTGLQVLDARTGATAVVSQLGSGLQPYGLARDGVYAGYTFSGSFKTSPTEVVRIDVTKLPELHC
jgi:hypothetical protein